MPSLCCGAALAPYADTPKVEVFRCRSCGTYAARFKQKRPEAPDSWRDPSITDNFLKALKYRRELQSELILTSLSDVFSRSPALDYACGQGDFLAQALARGIDCDGCELGIAEKDHLFKLTSAWTFPKNARRYETLLLLDVLEHHPDPGAFLRDLKSRGIKNLIIKVPLNTGPIALVSRALACIGRTSLLERLLLVDEPSPHLFFFSTEGLKNLVAREGFKFKGVLPLAEVGCELPQRLRREPTGVVRLFLSFAGWKLAALSTIWPDTAVLLFEASAA